MYYSLNFVLTLVLNWYKTNKKFAFTACLYGRGLWSIVHKTPKPKASQQRQVELKFAFCCHNASFYWWFTFETPAVVPLSKAPNLIASVNIQQRRIITSFKFKVQWAASGKGICGENTGVTRGKLGKKSNQQNSTNEVCDARICNLSYPESFCYN